MGWRAQVIGVAALVSVAGCGTTATNDGTVVPDGTSAPTTQATPVGTTPGSTATSSPGTTNVTAGFDGTYVLTGTQTCRMPGGAPSGSTSPLFADSALTFSGDTVVVGLTTEPHTAPVTISGPSFHVAAVFDTSGNLKTGAPGPMDLNLAVDGTTEDGGETISGTASDAGVNCTYTFTGRRSGTVAPPPSSPLPSSTSTTAASAIADPCHHITDPATGVAYDEWTHAGPGLGPVHLVSNCEFPWAEASFEGGPPRQLIVHWDGSVWTVTDEEAFCSAYAGPKPSSPPFEGEPGRIWFSYCQ